MPTRNTIAAGLVLIITVLLMVSCPEQPERSYTITYQLDGGTNAADNPSTYTAGNAAIPLHDPSRPGHTFAGWFGDAGFTEPELTEIPAESLGNIILYAKWSANTYVVTFDPQDGTESSPTSKTVTFDAAYGVLASTTRSGYDFMGWFTETGGSGKAISDPTPVTSASDHTLFAYWTPTVYTITYRNMESGTNHAANPTIFTIESSTITFLDPSKEGYYFDGWYSEETFDTPVETLDAGSIGNIGWSGRRLYLLRKSCLRLPFTHLEIFGSQKSGRDRYKGNLV